MAKSQWFVGTETAARYERQGEARGRIAGKAEGKIEAQIVTILMVLAKRGVE